LDFSSLVLVEKDKNNNIIREIGSYKVEEGAEYITKLYFDGNVVNMFFDTVKDLEEWEYTAVFYLFDEEIFTNGGYRIEDVDSEFNPTWHLQFELIEDHEQMEQRLEEICGLIKASIEKVLIDISGKKNEYI
jgi:hypothetical protein